MFTQSGSDLALPTAAEDIRHWGQLEGASLS